MPRGGAGGAGQGVLRRRQFRRRLDAQQRRPAAGREQPRPGGAASLSRSQPPVPHQEADRRRGAWRRGRRRARACHGGGLPRRLPGDALRRQFHPARISSRLRADGHAAAGDRRNQGGADVLHQPPRDRRRGLRHGSRRRAGAAGPGARGGDEARRRNRRELAARSDRDARHHARRPRRPRARGDRARIEGANWLRKTDDFKEGVKATAERRVPNFTGKR